MDKEIILFNKGINCFNDKSFYDAHEYWEDLWLNYKLSDALFIQGLIQLAVSFFHYYNGNLKGAKSMLKKCLGKFDAYDFQRGIDVIDLISRIERLQKRYSEIDDTSYNIDSYIFRLKVKDE